MQNDLKGRDLSQEILARMGRTDSRAGAGLAALDFGFALDIVHRLRLSMIPAPDETIGSAQLAVQLLGANFTF